MTHPLMTKMPEYLKSLAEALLAEMGGLSDGFGWYCNEAEFAAIVQRLQTASARPRARVRTRKSKGGKGT